MRRLLLLGGALWIARWAALETASAVARRLPPGPSPLESPRRPGWMPSSADRRRRFPPVL